MTDTGPGPERGRDPGATLGMLAFIVGLVWIGGGLAAAVVIRAPAERADEGHGRARVPKPVSDSGHLRLVELLLHEHGDARPLGQHGC